MQQEFFDFLIERMPEVYESVKDVSLNLTDGDEWYTNRMAFLTKNKLFLEKLVAEMPEKFINYGDVNEFFLMQKLYFLYPSHPPKKMLSLSWDVIKILLEIFEKDKREFYVELCLAKQLKASELVLYLVKDIYEKVYYVAMSIHDIEKVKDIGFIEQVLEIESMLWI